MDARRFRPGGGSPGEGEAAESGLFGGGPIGAAGASPRGKPGSKGVPVPKLRGKALGARAGAVERPCGIAGGTAGNAYAAGE